MDVLLGTILLLIVTRHQLVLASDSRKTILHPDGRLEKEVVHKIHSVNDFFYASSGLHSAPGENFHLPLFIKSILQRYGNLDKAVHGLATALTPALHNYFLQLKKSQPKLLKMLLQHNGYGGEIFVIKQVHKIPSVYLLEYTLKLDEKVAVLLDTWKISTQNIRGKDGCFWRAAGSTSFLKNYRPLPGDLAQCPQKKARELMERAIQQDPLFTGPPITILEMEEGGAAVLKQV